jgi:hypothetical protein
MYSATKKMLVTMNRAMKAEQHHHVRRGALFVLAALGEIACA